MVVDPVPALQATVLMFYGVNFFVLGMVLLGYGELKDAGPIFLVAGGINGLIALNVFNSNLAAGLGDFIIVAFLVLVFAVTWLAAGIIAILGHDVVPLSSLGIFFGLAMIPFAAFLAQAEDLPSRVWLTVNVVSWIWVFFTLPLAFIFKWISPKIAGWSFLIQAFYTLWIPAALLIAGVSIP